MCLILAVYLLVINVLEIFIFVQISSGRVWKKYFNVFWWYAADMMGKHVFLFWKGGSRYTYLHMQTRLSIIGREMHEEQLFPLKLCKAWLLKHILRSPNYILPRVICVMCMIYIGSSRSGALTIYWDVFCTHGMCRSSLCSENTKHCDVGDLCRSLKYNAMQCNRKSKTWLIFVRNATNVAGVKLFWGWHKIN